MATSRSIAKGGLEAHTSPSAVGETHSIESSSAPARASGSPKVAHLAENLSAWFLVALLAWAQFPLGSNRPWAWSLLAVLVALNWLLWLPAAIADSESAMRAFRRIQVPALAMLAVLLWAYLQAVTWTPDAWHNAIWSVGSGIGGLRTSGSISMNRFSTVTEVMKLLTYLSAFWIAYVCARRHELARRLFVAIFVIGVAYAVYGLVLHFANTSQIQIFQDVPSAYGSDVVGGFVSKNSFATYDGISLMVGISFLLEMARQSIVTTRGSRTLSRSALQFMLGRGAAAVMGVLLLIAALMASDSRAGIAAMVVGLAILFSLTPASARTGAASWLYWGAAPIAALVIFLFLVEGGNVAERFASLFDSGAPREIRPVLWSAAERMIWDHPMLGVGLGAFRDAYNLYADEFFPFVVDRAHNDFLEFAAGLGLPAAITWWSAMALILVQCVRGAIARRRRQMYAIAGASSLGLVAFHSIFDFSLQMPAVSLLVAITLGVGFAQAFGTDRVQGTPASAI